MDFATFLLVNAALFIRPGEISPALAGVPIYQGLILLCLAVSAPKLVAQWTARPLSARPATVCMLGLLASAVMSHLSRLNVGQALAAGADFGRITLYYLLFVAVVDTPSRLRGMLLGLLAFIAVMTALALCQYHGLVDIPTLKVLERNEEDPATGEILVILQLVGTGIFNDPNDFSLALSLGCLISLYLAGERRYGLLRGLWLGFLGLFGYAITLTQSRGGVLALGAGLLSLLASRVGLRRAAVAGALAFSLALPLLGGRLAKMSTSSDTAQERIHLWRDALEQFRRAPLFGIGVNTLADEIGLVAHNSYVHSFAEMGLMGGTCFVGLFLICAAILLADGRPGEMDADPDLRRARPYLLAILSMFAVGLFSLTRCYVASTYVPAALAESYQNLVCPSPWPRVAMGSRLAAILIGVSLACVVGLFTFVRVFLQ